MLFYEPLFLFVVLPVIYTVYLLLRRLARGAIGWVALASCAFYLWAEPSFFWLILASSALDYVLAQWIARRRPGPWLALGICGNLAILGVFKYAGFVVGQIANPALSWLSATALPIPEIALPIGISFIVFEKITYLVDIHRGISAPAATFPKYLFFVFFFPKLLAGPIIKYHEIEPQLRSAPPLGVELFALGVERFATGMVKKVLLADPAAAISDQIFSAPAYLIGQLDAWLGALFFTAQIYFDFAGYSDMAIGLAMMLGFRIRENFNFPYTSISSRSSGAAGISRFRPGLGSISTYRWAETVFRCGAATSTWLSAFWLPAFGTAPVGPSCSGEPITDFFSSLSERALASGFTPFQPGFRSCLRSW